MFTVARLFLRVLPVLYMLGIWLQSSFFDPEKIGQYSSMISNEMVLVFGAFFELAHLVQFGILYLFLIIAFLTFGEIDKQKQKIAFIISVGYGFVDELHQFYVPFRSFSIIDLIKDVIGVWVIWYLINKFYYKNNQSKLGTALKRIAMRSNQNKSI